MTTDTAITETIRRPGQEPLTVTVHARFADGSAWATEGKNADKGYHLHADGMVSHQHYRNGDLVKTKPLIGFRWKTTPYIAYGADDILSSLSRACDEARERGLDVCEVKAGENMPITFTVATEDAFLDFETWVWDGETLVIA